jgi:hypothetical protein
VKDDEIEGNAPDVTGSSFEGQIQVVNVVFTITSKGEEVLPRGGAQSGVCIGAHEEDISLLFVERFEHHRNCIYRLLEKSHENGG